MKICGAIQRGRRQIPELVGDDEVIDRADGGVDGEALRVLAAGGRDGDLIGRLQEAVVRGWDERALVVELAWYVLDALAHQRLRDRPRRAVAAREAVQGDVAEVAVGVGG